MTEEQIRSCLESYGIAMRTRGHPGAFAELIITEKQATTWLHFDGKADMRRAATVEDSLRLAWEYVLDMPQAWTDELIAATLGIAA